MADVNPRNLPVGVLGSPGLSGAMICARCGRACSPPNAGATASGPPAAGDKMYFEADLGWVCGVCADPEGLAARMAYQQQTGRSLPHD